MTDFAESLLANIQVRHHNGQCAYGEWLPVRDETVPGYVGDAIADEIVELDEDQGRVEIGGEIWVWKK